MQGSQVQSSQEKKTQSIIKGKSVTLNFGGYTF